MPNKSWKTNKTTLIVGEGADEEAFLKHVKSRFITRDSGKSVKIKNAQGKGATHVIEWTIRQMALATYDTIAILLDTDVDYSIEAQQKAARNNIVLLPSSPCFEAEMLRLIGQNPVGNSKALKRQFAPLVNNRATEMESYQANFSEEVLIQNRLNSDAINNLLQILGV